jgi:hypothetical protein
MTRPLSLKSQLKRAKEAAEVLGLPPLTAFVARDGTRLEFVAPSPLPVLASGDAQEEDEASRRVRAAFQGKRHVAA